MPVSLWFRVTAAQLHGALTQMSRVSSVGSACEVKRGNIFTVEEVNLTGEVILYAAAWMTWSDLVCGCNKVGIRCSFELP